MPLNQSYWAKFSASVKWHSFIKLRHIYQQTVCPLFSLPVELNLAYTLD